MGHQRALKHAIALRQKTAEKIDAAQKSRDITATWVDFDHITQAIDQLIECRRALKYTYIMGYYLQDNTSAKALFEHHQEMLEKNTEKLHEITQTPIEEIQGKYSRSDVMNLTKITSRFLLSVLENLAGGEVSMGDDSELESPLKMAKIDG